MQLLITDSKGMRTRLLQFGWLQMALVAVLLLSALLMLSGTVYHFVFLKAAREGWPLVSQVVHLVVRDEIAQRDRFMRENLEAMAHKVGEMQARVMKIELTAERISGPAGLKSEAAPATAPRNVTGGGRGGPYLPLGSPSLELLERSLQQLDETAARQADLFTLAESRLFESRLQALLRPSTPPVEGTVGSGFGFRSDPLTGRTALHTGLDFPADIGTPVRAAAGGLVQGIEWHPEYGHLVVLDHGGGLSTRYAHLSRALVAAGDLVKRGQTIAEVGNSGRSTGPHLHFEVLVEGVPQDPARFLAGAPPPLAQRGASPRR